MNDRERAVELYGSGVGTSEIGRRPGRSKQTIHGWVRAKPVRCPACGTQRVLTADHADVTRRCDDCERERRRKRRRYQVHRMWEAGASTAEIATAIGVSTRTVTQTVTSMRANGWELSHRYSEARRKRMYAGRWDAA